MVDPIFQSDNYQLARKLMDAESLQQEAIAANIANAETPGYRRVDVAPDFEERLKASYQAGESVGSLDSLQPKLAEDPNARAIRTDGNTVEVDKELLAMNKNAVEYGYLTDVVSQNIKQLKIAISGQAS